MQQKHAPFCHNELSDQHPHPLLPNPPQQKSRRMIHRQLSLPHPFPLNVLPPHPPQQQSRRIIHRQEDIPFPLSHPHPQFVAVKSLMLNPPFRFIYSFILCVRRKSVPYGRRKFSSCENGLPDSLPDSFCTVRSASAVPHSAGPSRIRFRGFSCRIL